MELKIVGAGIVISVCGLTGFYISDYYVKRPQHLRSLQSALIFLETEIAYTATPLPVAMENVSKCVNEPTRCLFVAAKEGIKNLNYTAEESWSYGLAKYRENSALTTSDLEIVKTLGSRLGKSGVNEQIKEIRLIREQLKQAEAVAEADKTTNERLWRTMGFLIGIFLVVLLY
jgi:stage III sporulation protein AB